MKISAQTLDLMRGVLSSEQDLPYQTPDVPTSRVERDRDDRLWPSLFWEDQKGRGIAGYGLWLGLAMVAAGLVFGWANMSSRSNHASPQCQPGTQAPPAAQNSAEPRRYTCGPCGMG